MNKEFMLSLFNDKGSARNVQKAIGPSEIGGCSRKTWHRLQGTPKTNLNTLSMSAWMGTAIHKHIERKLLSLDPFHERYLLEVEVEHDGLRGHVDVYDKESCEVVDWKTTTKKNLSSFPSDQYWQQVQLYGWLLTNNGYAVETVTLVGIPRDGNELNVVFASQPYDESAALAGLEWLRQVQESVDPPEPEKHARFCRDYCGFYDPTEEVGCPSMQGAKK
jgi:hypothetical protein